MEDLEDKLEKLKNVIVLLQYCYTEKNEYAISKIIDKVDLEIEYLCDDLRLDYREETDGLY